MKVRIVVVLLIVILIIVTAIVIFNRINHIPPSDAQVLENEGQVCFAPGSSDTVIVHIYSGRCFQTYCTKVYEREGSIEVNNETFVVQLESHFVVSDLTKPGKGCAADCEGAGWVELMTSELLPDTYTVRHGDKIIGQLQIPLSSQYSVCFGGSQ